MTLLPQVRDQITEAARRMEGTRRPARRSVPGWRRPPRINAARAVPLLGVLVVLAVAVPFLALSGSRAGRAGSPVGVEVVLRAHAASGPVSQSAIAQTLAILHRRLRAVFPDVTVTPGPGDEVFVVVQHAPANAQAQIITLSRPGQLDFYDWEADALTPSGRTVAGQLRIQNPKAMLISQGHGLAAPGAPGAGSLNLYQAVKLASTVRSPAVGVFNARFGPQYYLFGDPGSSACPRANSRPDRGVHCLLAGPASSSRALELGVPSGVSYRHARVLAVPRGVVLVQATPEAAGSPLAVSDPRAQYYVLLDRAGLTGSQITHPRQSTDSSGSPDVTFAFTPIGARRFADMTAAVAHRGAIDSTLAGQLDQHFAVVLDGELMSVPSIDFKTYPDGIVGGNGAQITGHFTIQTVRDIAIDLRYGPLPLQLTQAQSS